MTYSTNHVRLLKNLWKEEINFSKKKIRIVSVKTIFAFFACDSQGLPETAIYVGRGRGEPGRTYPNTMGWYPKSNVYMNF